MLQSGKQWLHTASVDDKFDCKAKDLFKLSQIGKRKRKKINHETAN